MRTLFLTLVLCCTATAQVGLPVCHKWDWKHAHEIQVPCKVPSKLVPHGKVAQTVGHAFEITAKTTGEVVLVAAFLYFSALRAGGVQVR